MSQRRISILKAPDTGRSQYSSIKTQKATKSSGVIRAIAKNWDETKKIGAVKAVMHSESRKRVRSARQAPDMTQSSGSDCGSSDGHSDYPEARDLGSKVQLILVESGVKSSRKSVKSAGNQLGTQHHEVLMSLIADLASRSKDRLDWGVIERQAINGVWRKMESDRNTTIEQLDMNQMDEGLDREVRVYERLGDLWCTLDKLEITKFMPDGHLQYFNRSKRYRLKILSKQIEELEDLTIVKQRPAEGTHNSQGLVFENPSLDGVDRKYAPDNSWRRLVAYLKAMAAASLDRMKGHPFDDIQGIPDATFGMTSVAVPVGKQSEDVILGACDAIEVQSRAEQETTVSESKDEAEKFEAAMKACDDRHEARMRGIDSRLEGMTHQLTKLAKELKSMRLEATLSLEISDQIDPKISIVRSNENLSRPLTVRSPGAYQSNGDHSLPAGYDSRLFLHYI